jgi:hypothetical protein
VEGSVVTRKQRLSYAISTGILFIFGAAVYGLCFSAYGVALMCAVGGSLFGGIVSGFILMFRFFKTPRSKKLKVAASILFPVTFGVVVGIGVYSFLPYYVSNIIILLRTKKGGDPLQEETLTYKVNNITWVVSLCLLVASLAGIYLYSYIGEVNISKDIFSKTGYKSGTPDYAIIRNYYYNQDHSDFVSKEDYHYSINDGALFVLAQNNGIITSDILFADSNGEYTNRNTQDHQTGANSLWLRADLDKLFTDVTVTKKGTVYAYKISIDARTVEELTKAYVDNIESSDFSEAVKKRFEVPEMIQATLNTQDKTYADPGEIQLFDNAGQQLACLKLDDGRYVVFCDALTTGDTGYKVTASYQGQTIPLLTYDDIVQSRIFSSSK